YEHQLLRAPQQLLANAFLVQNYVPAYIFGPGIVPAWSLAIEVVFYLCVPLLGLLAIHLARRGTVTPLQAAWLPVALMIAIGFTSKAALRVDPSLGAVWELGFPAHADWFAGGMAVAVLRVRWEDGLLALPRHWRVTAAAIGLILGVAAVALYDAGTFTYLEYQTPIVITCSIGLALVVFAESQSRLISVLNWRPIVAAGLISYSIFLWHDPLLRFLRSHGLTHAGVSGFVFNLVLLASITIVLSAASYLVVERPALSRKRVWQGG